MAIRLGHLTPSIIRASLFFLIFFLSPTIVSAQAIIGNITDSGVVAKFSKFEINFQISNTTANLENYFFPYDAAPPTGVTPKAGLTVDALFTFDNWQSTIVQPAYFHQNYIHAIKNNADWMYPEGNPLWKVRFSPHRPGSWQYRIRVTDDNGTVTSAARTFTVTDSTRRGFIRVSKSDRRYFEFDDGTYFPALGYNMNFDHVSWQNPILQNTENFQVMGQNGIQLIRLWLSQWSIFGTKWNPWRCIESRCHADWPELTKDVFYRDHDLSLTLFSSRNPCMSSGHWLSPKIAIKPNTNYRVRARVRTTEITGPRIAGQPFGFVVKITDNGNSWLDGAENDCADPGVGKTVTAYLGNSDWTEVEGTYTTPANINFLSSVYLTLTNVTAGAAYVDRVSIEENLGNNQYGPNVLIKPNMNHLQYADPNLAARFDKVVELAEQNGVYLKPVILEWQDDGQNMVSPQGFYGNWRNMHNVRWYQQAWWRYLQARWGYSTAIHSWELLNEGDPYNGHHYALADEFGKYMKCGVFGQVLPREDGVKCNPQSPNYHLTSTSTWTDYPKSLFWENQNYPNMDFADIHRYAFRGGGANNLVVDQIARPVAGANMNGYSTADLNFYDTARMTEEMSKVVAASRPTMPVIRGETGLVDGGDTNNYTRSLDADIYGTLAGQGQGIWLHNFVWGQINPGGLIESYWYENYNGRHIYGTKDQRGHFGAYYRFIKDIPLSNGAYQDAAVITSNPAIRAWGQKDLQNGRLHLWIQNINHTWNNTSPAAITGATVTVTGFRPNAVYQLEWWDTYLGQPTQQTTITANTGGNLVITVPNLTTDLAVRVGSYGVGSPTPAPTLPPNPGDLNGDGKIDGIDFILRLKNGGDYSVWLQNYVR